MNTPIDHLKTTIRKINTTADFWAMGISRPAFYLHWEIDTKTTLTLTRAQIPRLPDPKTNLKKLTKKPYDTITSLQDLETTKQFSTNIPSPLNTQTALTYTHL